MNKFSKLSRAEMKNVLGGNQVACSPGKPCTHTIYTSIDHGILVTYSGYCEARPGTCGCADSTPGSIYFDFEDDCTQVHGIE